MADNPRIRDRRDGSKVSKQKHEIDYLMKEHNISRQAAVAAQNKAGPNRAKVERYIEIKKKIGHY